MPSYCVFMGFESKFDFLFYSSLFLRPPKLATVKDRADAVKND